MAALLGCRIHVGLKKPVQIMRTRLNHDLEPSFCLEKLGTFSCLGRAYLPWQRTLHKRQISSDL